MERTMQPETRRDRIRRWLFSAALSAALLAATLLVTKATYLNNDDTNILYVLAGYRTGAPYPAHRFVNILLTAPVYALYRLAPAVPWWTVWHVFALWLSLTVLCASLGRIGAGVGCRRWLSYAAFTLLYLAGYVYAVYTVSFTLTAGLLGAAGAALLLSLDGRRDGKAARFFVCVGSAGLLFLCVLMRRSSGVCAACFYGAALLYRLLRDGRDGGARAVRRTLLCAGGAALAFAVALTSDALGVRLTNPADYPAFDAARGHFVDYPHATYDDDPAFYAALGWDGTVYDLADSFCYLDPAVTAESMEAAVAHASPAGAGETGFSDKLKAAFVRGEQFFRGSGVSQRLLALPAALTLLCALLYAWAKAKAEAKAKRNGAALLCALATAAGAFLLCAYLCYTGRFPVRTFQLIALLAASVLAPCCLLLYVPGGQGGRGRKRAWRLIAAGALGLCLLWSAVGGVRAALTYDKTAVVAKNDAAERYAAAHKENVYITDVSSIENLSLYTVWGEDAPTNLVDWGGTSMHAGWKDAQLSQNGLLPFTGDVFRRENVYFLTERDGKYLDMLFAYLSAHAGASGYTLTDTVDGDIAVYRFEFIKEAGA